MFLAVSIAAVAFSLGWVRRGRIEQAKRIAARCVVI